MIYNILVCNNADQLQQRLRNFPATATVNAEYGKIIVEGSVRTHTHPACKCVNCCCNVNAVGTATFDIDTFGGILAVLGEKSPKTFDPRIPQNLLWDLVAFVDINGAHKLSDWVANKRSELGQSSYNNIANVVDAFWALQAAFHTIVAADSVTPLDDAVIDITTIYCRLRDKLHAILQADQSLLHAGIVYRDNQFTINQASFKGIIDNKVIVRSSDGIVNHFYRAPNGLLVNRVVGYNPSLSQITITLAHPEYNVDCAAFAADYWGGDSNQERCIAVSPAGQRFSWQDAVKIARALATL